ncbi:hypothetical protein [Rhabdochromatium marinum]|uniref:hypothetical protein n=1 Tax=Rhabdochromatium marinum TaxID=48729 RepID=UPI00190418DB|nr:hypothetical protein [Rhabdochromatium marinum]
MSFIIWLIIALAAFSCLDLFSTHWQEGAFCPIVFGIAVFVLLFKLAQRAGSISYGGFDDGGDGGGDGGD